jgi:MFS transporter, DHA1 family, multidrug resistance protein
LTGPLAFGPLSEAFGRRRPLLTALLLLTVFQLPVALAQDVETVLVFRLLSGIAGSAAISIPPAMAVDFLTPAQRLLCVNFYMAFTMGGPAVGPIAGSFITVRYGWRWTAWITLILAGTTGLFAFFAIPESCADVLLQRKAAKLRKMTCNDQLHAKRDSSPITFRILMNKYMTKAIQLLILEPILLIFTLYSASVYGLLYLLFFSVPYTYIKTRQWSVESASLPFLAILAGILLGATTTLIGDFTWWLRRFRARGNKFLPEDRLPNLMLSAILLPVGLLWMAWTSTKSVPWAAQVCSGVLVGAGVELNLYSTTAYFIDVYQLHSNSAMSGFICVRSAVAFAFPLFAIQMYERLSVHWATTLLALMFTALAPLPFLFWHYGKRIRSWSRYSFDD